MGDNVAAASLLPRLTANTPQALICGADGYDGGDVPVSYENSQAAAHYCVALGICRRIGPTANNGAPANVSSIANNMGSNSDGLERRHEATLPMYSVAVPMLLT